MKHLLTKLSSIVLLILTVLQWSRQEQLLCQSPVSKKEMETNTGWWCALGHPKPQSARCLVLGVAGWLHGSWLQARPVFSPPKQMSAKWALSDKGGDSGTALPWGLPLRFCSWKAALSPGAMTSICISGTTWWDHQWAESPGEAASIPCCLTHFLSWYHPASPRVVQILPKPLLSCITWSFRLYYKGTPPASDQGIGVLRNQLTSSQRKPSLKYGWRCFFPCQNCLCHLKKTKGKKLVNVRFV